MAEASKIWVIEPAADPHDGYWQDREIWARVIVAAPTAAQARLVAEHWALKTPLPHIGNESPSPRAGFTDMRLYHVHEAPPSIAPSSDPARIEEGILAAENQDDLEGHRAHRGRFPAG